MAHVCGSAVQYARMPKNKQPRSKGNAVDESNGTSIYLKKPS